MKYQLNKPMTGAWVKATELKNGTRAKIVSETKPMPSQFKDDDGNVKNQDVCKVRFEGDAEVYNVSLNRVTINGLIEAYGDESLNWVNKPLTAETEKVRVGGRTVTVLYLIPDGFQKVDDANGYAMIASREQIENQNEDIPVINEEAQETQVHMEDIPF